MGPAIEPNKEKQHYNHSKADTPRAKNQKVRQMDVVAEIFLTVVFAAALGFALVDYQAGRMKRVVVWGCVASIAVSIGIAARIYNRIEARSAFPAGFVRPIVTIVSANGRLRIGKPVQF